MSQVKLINFSGRTIKVGEPVKLHAINKNSFDYAPLGSFGLIGTAAEQITFGSWGLINLLGSGSTVIGANEITLAMLEKITASVLGRINAGEGDVETLSPAQLTALIELFSTTDTTKGLVPGSSNLGAEYVLNAKRQWVVPTGREPDRINFVDNATPTISNYNTTWAAIWGPYPKVRCIIIIDANTRDELPPMTRFTYVDDVLVSASYDLGTPLTGYLLLSK